MKRRILFCNIAWMKYYRGVTCDDIPEGNQGYIKKYSNGGEVHNFKERKGMVHGFVEPRTIKGKVCEIKIEKIDPHYKNKEKIDDVLVIFCARERNQPCRIVGWYKNAIVYRRMQGSGVDQYNIVANYQDTTLLPVNERDIIVPSKRKKDALYGFGQASYWFADREEAQGFVQSILMRIENYPIQTYREEEVLTEGERTRAYVNLYERNIEARNKCIEKYGAKCQICGFDAAIKYGKEYGGMIEVHHIVPLNEREGVYQIDPIQDLIPVCPNCHAILHKKVDGNTISIEELKRKIKKS